MNVNVIVIIKDRKKVQMILFTSEVLNETVIFDGEIIHLKIQKEVKIKIYQITLNNEVEIEINVNVVDLSDDWVDKKGKNLKILTITVIEDHLICYVIKIVVYHNTKSVIENFCYLVVRVIVEMVNI